MLVILLIFIAKSLTIFRFQWAALHIAHLLSLDRPSDIAKALPNLPRGLEKTYGEIFDRTTSPDNSLRDIAIRTFHWMLARDGNADIEQLLLLVCQDPDNDVINPINIDPETILKACQNLVVQEGQYPLEGDDSPLGQSPPEHDYAPPRDYVRPPDGGTLHEAGSHFRERNNHLSGSLASRNPRVFRPGPGHPPNLPSFSPPIPRSLHRGPPSPPPFNWPDGPPRPGPPSGGGGKRAIDGPPIMVNLRPRPLVSRSRSRKKEPAKVSLGLRAALSGRSRSRSGSPPQRDWKQAVNTRPKFRFAHLSVQEYCETIQWTQQVSHSFAAKICLFFLLQPKKQFVSVSPPSCTSLRSDTISPVVVRDYADSFWIYHAQRCWASALTHQDKRLVAPATRFLGFPNETSTSFDSWLSRFSWNTHLDPSLRPAFWSIKRGQKSVGVKQLQSVRFNFRSQSSLAVCFFGLDHIFLSSTDDNIVIPTLLSQPAWYLSEATWVFSHFLTSRMLRMILKPLVQIDAEQTNKFLWNLIHSISSHPLAPIYAASSADYSELCLSLAELVHTLHVRDCVEMCGMIISFLLYPYPTIAGRSFLFDSEGQVLHAASKIMSLGANIDYSLRVAVQKYRWQDIVWLMERGATPGY
jgi:hypothetical protein